MNSDDFLVSFQSAILSSAFEEHYGQRLKTDAPPELSEPAMTSIRLPSMSLRCFGGYFGRINTECLGVVDGRYSCAS